MHWQYEPYGCTTGGGGRLYVSANHLYGQKKAVSYQREHKNKKQSVELQALRFLRGSTRDSVTPAVYQFLSSLGIAATDAATAYTLLVGVYEKAQRDRTGMETLSKLKGVITTGETSGDLRTR